MKTGENINTGELIANICHFVLVAAGSTRLRDEVGTKGAMKVFFSTEAENYAPESEVEFQRRYDAAVAVQSSNGKRGEEAEINALIALEMEERAKEPRGTVVEETQWLVFRPDASEKENRMGWIQDSPIGTMALVENWKGLEKRLCEDCRHDEPTAKAMVAAMAEYTEANQGDYLVWELQGKHIEQSGWKIQKLGNIKDSPVDLLRSLREDIDKGREPALAR